jgi:hypothetical protein
MFGYAAGIADIQVTWPDGTTADCLQKVYRRRVRWLSASSSQ